MGFKLSICLSESGKVYLPWIRSQPVVNFSYGGKVGGLEETTIHTLDAFIRKDRGPQLEVVQRGFWVHGVGDLRSYLRSAEQFTIEGRRQ